MSTTVAPGATIETGAEVDDATRYVLMELRDVNTDQAFGTGSAPSGTTDPETVKVSIKVDENAPAGAYYLSADVCAADQCRDDQPRTEYRRGSDLNFLSKTRIPDSEGVGSITSCVVIYPIRVE